MFGWMRATTRKTKKLYYSETKKKKRKKSRVDIERKNTSKSDLKCNLEEYKIQRVHKKMSLFDFKSTKKSFPFSMNHRCSKKIVCLFFLRHFVWIFLRFVNSCVCMCPYVCFTILSNTIVFFLSSFYMSLTEEE